MDLRELLPPALAGLDGSVEDYWRARIAQCFNDTYAGLPLIKFPEDLRVYEELLWEQAPDLVIEVGTHVGGSALWFRDRLLTLERYGRVSAPRVICLDVNQEVPRTALTLADARYAEHIDLVECDICDPGAVALVAERVPEGANCLVVEDAAHTYEVTLASLRGLARFVPPGGYFIVEDGVVDVEQLRIDDDWPRGVLAAAEDWLQEDEGRAFEVRRELERYGVTCHLRGFLRRTA